MASKRKDNHASNPFPKRARNDGPTGPNNSFRKEGPFPDRRKHGGRLPKPEREALIKRKGVEEDNTPADKREYNETDQKLGKIYAQLADNSTDLRIEAGKQLLLELGKIKTNREDILKAFKRLFRGLCSGRDSARSGFFMILTALIRDVFEDENPVIQASELVTMAEETTHIGGNASGQVSLLLAWHKLYLNYSNKHKGTQGS
jgi:hypothetical protein